MTAPSADKQRSGRNAHPLLLGMQNGIETLENYLAVSYKIKHTLKDDSEILLLGSYPNELITSLHTKICTWIFKAALVIHCQNMEAAKMSFNRWMDK